MPTARTASSVNHPGPSRPPAPHQKKAAATRKPTATRKPAATRAVAPVRKTRSTAAPKLARAGQRSAPVSVLETDAVIKAATGRSWAQWFRLLDRMDVAEVGHDAVVRRLADDHECPRWWRQRIAAAHAEARGLQAPQRRALAANTSRTLAVPVEDLWRAWQGRGPAKWLQAKFKVQRANENKSMRLAWPDDTSVEIYFWAKGDRRSQVNIMHRQLADANEVAAKKAFWAGALERLRAALE